MIGPRHAFNVCYRSVHFPSLTLKHEYRISHSFSRFYGDVLTDKSRDALAQKAGLLLLCIGRFIKCRIIFVGMVSVPQRPKLTNVSVSILGPTS
uniref:Metallopeptidase M24 family protein n=1 Tax=Rhizophora mucronata TaxID=61149 RepID=A0A2P2LWK2_RHIMU